MPLAFPASACGRFTSNDHVMCREAGSHQTEMLKEQPLYHCLFTVLFLGSLFFFLLLFLYSSPAKKRQKIVGFSVCRWCHVKSYKFSYPPPLAAPCFYFFSGTTVYLRACLSLIKQTRSVPFRIPTPSQTRQSKRNVHTVPHHRASSSGMNTTKPTCFHLQPCHQTHKCICIYIYIHTYTHP